jgi:hypothetical protein
MRVLQLMPVLAIAGAAAAQPADVHWRATALPGEIVAGPAFVPRDTCPCVAGAPENEPNCGLPTDSVNGGCNYTPNQFSTIVPGQTICGTAGTQQVNGVDTRDTDWYRFTLATTSDIYWTVRPEFPARLIILRGETCGMTEVVTEVAPACTDYTISALDQPPGTYVVFVATSTFTGFTCGSPGTGYSATLTTGPVNDLCQNAVDVSAGGTFVGTLVDATNDGTASCGASAANPDVWYRFAAPACGTLTLTTCGTHDAPGADQGMDTVLAAFAGCGGTQLACNDDWTGSACTGMDSGLHRDSAIMVPVATGEDVRVRVSKYGAVAPGPFQLNVSFVPALANDSCAGASQIYAGLTPFCTSGATTDGPTHPGCVEVTRDIWYVYASNCAGIVSINTCNDSTFDTTLAVYRTGDCAAVGGGTLLACNDDAGCGLLGRASRVSFRGVPGGLYLVRVGGYFNATGTGTLSLACNPCTCDFNADGVLNSQDFFDFLGCFFGTSCPPGTNADFNADSVVNSQDFFDFLSCFFAPPGGC